jgi:diketogulonate reductase-like aldo/keto reductase
MSGFRCIARGVHMVHLLQEGARLNNLLRNDLPCNVIPSLTHILTEMPTNMPCDSDVTHVIRHMHLYPAQRHYKQTNRFIPPFLRLAVPQFPAPRHPASTSRHQSMADQSGPDVLPVAAHNGNQDAPSLPTSVSAPLPLLNSTRTIPTLIYGTAWKKERTADLVYQAIKAGFRAIDTAAQPKHYQEDLVGDGMRRAIREGIVNREDLFVSHSLSVHIVHVAVSRFSLIQHDKARAVESADIPKIQTKYTPPDGQDLSNMPYSASLPLAEQIHASIASSLHNLRTSDTDSAPYLDSLLLHSPLPTFAETLAAWSVLVTYFHSGTIRHIGISNCSLAILKPLSAHPTKPAVVQNRFRHLGGGKGYVRHLRAFCREAGIVFQGFWTLTGNPALVGSEVVGELAERVGVEREVALYALVVGLGGMSVLDGTTRQERMEGDLDGVRKVGEWAAVEGNEGEWAGIMGRFRELLGE